jgi:protein MpaA
VLHLVLAAALALGGHSAAAQPFSVHGISGTLPPGWRVLHRRLTPCTDPQEVLAVSSFRVARRPKLDSHGAFLLLEERHNSTDGLRPRPAHFSLEGPPQGLTCCEPFRGASGWPVDFQAAGRGFYGYAYVEAKADPQLRGELLEILEGLRYRDHRPRRSRSLGLPWAGRLVGGVQLPAAGWHFFTWDPVLRRKPDRDWRRYGNARVVRTVLRVIDGYAAAHPDAPRVGIGDLSRPHGGDFGPRFGGLGHVSHQNGLDVDVYYPRRDGREAAPTRPAQIDRALAQDLVDRFVRAGAVRIFVGPSTGLSGPRHVVSVLPHHDNHLHARFAVRSVRRTVFLGRSVRGFPISALERGDPDSSRKVLVVGCIHGNECAGLAVVRGLARARIRGDVDLWLVPNLNPDGYAAGTRQNAHGVDLNRNFPAMWQRIGRPGSLQWSGPRPLSEPESRIARRLILQLRPALTLWFHQPQAIVRAWGPSIPAARRYARLAGVPFRALAWPNGTVSNWQNHLDPHAASFVVELPGGPLTPSAAKPYADALLRLAQ